jgi:hypothetical protein
MIAEPYINTAGPCAGYINWYKPGEPTYIYSMPYADFEREKLKQLAEKKFPRYPSESYWGIPLGGDGYRLSENHSINVIGYSATMWERDTESNRLLKRAEFLKAVCEKEGVEWLPKEKCDCKESKKSINGCGICDPNVRPGPLTSPPPERDYFTKDEVEAQIKHCHHLRHEVIEQEREEEKDFRVDLFSVMQHLSDILGRHFKQDAADLIKYLRDKHIHR